MYDRWMAATIAINGPLKKRFSDIMPTFMNSYSSSHILPVRPLKPATILYERLPTMEQNNIGVKEVMRLCKSNRKIEDVLLSVKANQ